MRLRSLAAPALTPALGLLLGPLTLSAPAHATNVPALQRLAAELAARRDAGRGPAFQALLASPRPGPVGAADRDVQILYLDARGFPRTYATDNEMAAETVSTDEAHPGGSSGLGLTGSTTVPGELAIWDGGAVRTSHQELTGRASQEDGASSFSNHATHVSGTMIGEGVDPTAKGMSYEGELHCYDWNSDDSEMASAAAQGLLISNHSYGFITGWYQDSQGDWYWYGDLDVDSSEDYGFGYYDSNAQAWDAISFNAPNYLIVGSAGNDRNDFGPGPGGTHYHWDGSWVQSNDSHDADGGATGYDTVAWLKNAKNILSVGAINDIPGGWTSAGDVVMSTFSGWGPTDDGRIKPDLVANGVGLRSSIASSNTSYASYSGTSMASPNASGSANLVAQHWKVTHGGPARAATLKTILCSTTDEAGPDPGPDYMHGWGLLNTASAALLVQADADAAAGTSHVIEGTLANGATDEYFVTIDSPTDVRLGLGWTDPAGTPPAPALDPPDAMLVNDLDVEFEVVDVVYQPWVLDPSNPSAAATNGRNFRDNLEQIEVALVPAGVHRIRVYHQGTLANGSQDYSLVCSAPMSLTNPSTAAPERAANASDTRVAPNPFAGETSISFTLEREAAVATAIFDVAGRLVRATSAERLAAGPHRHDWDGRDESGR
ncbi:MAG: S8 family serine peptidase, partial [Gemmatimonadetes bacterium]|nr:S8 family serine peptidase [Gemmatimonadota bacterium]